MAVSERGALAPEGLAETVAGDGLTEGRWLHRVALRVGCDLLAIGAGLAAFAALAGRVGWIQVGWAVAYVVVAILIDASHVRREWNYVEECVLALKVGLAALVITATVGFLIAAPVSRILFLTVTAVMVVARPLTAWASDRLWPERFLSQDLLLVCTEDEHAAVLDAIAELRVRRHRIVGRMTEGGEVYGVTRRGTMSDDLRAFGLLDGCEVLRPSALILGASQPKDPSFPEAVTAANESGIMVRSFPRFFEEAYGRVPLASLETSWFVFDIGPLHRLRYRTARRIADVLAGLLLTAAFGVLLPVLSILVKLGSPGPVLFKQVRVGQSGRHFKMLKLRTMPVDAEASGPRFAEPADPRVNGFGRFLRRSRLDELPQGINLIRGEMSLVGPRPERPEFVDQFEDVLPFYAKRHLIKPGLTGWAQVHEGYGANIADTVRKLERDLFYLKYQSLSLDLRILTATITSVLRFAGR